MKNTKNLILAFAAVTALLTSMACNRDDSANVNQARIFTEYELFYNGNDDKTYARATFRFNNAFGTKLELSEPSNVAFNGDELTFNNLLAYYEREYAGFVTSGQFSWTDTEGNTYNNTIEVHPIDYAAGLDTIDRANSFELFFTGDPLSADEAVTVTINGENEGDARVFTTNDLGSQSIILARDRLQEIGMGPGTIWLDRSFQPDLSEETEVGGILRGRYRPVNAEVYLK